MVQIQGNTVRFRFFRPRARRVHVLGDFNAWGQQALAMSRCDDGYWTATVTLPPGTYRFRYRADDQWFTDYAAFGVEYGPMGVDSIVRVGGPAEADESAPAATGAVRAEKGRRAPNRPPKNLPPAGYRQTRTAAAVPDKQP